MTMRPDRLQLDGALHRSPPLDEPMLPVPSNDQANLARADARVLAAEVRALREERAWCGTNHGNNICPVGLQKVRELQATIARAEAEMSLAREAGFDAVDLRDLETALKGEP